MDDSASPAGAAQPGRIALASDISRLVPYLRHQLASVAHQAPAVPSGTPRVAAVLAPLYVRHGLPHLLFTRRTTTLSAHRGEISFPGGSRDPGDASLTQTALRECFEELRLDPASVDVLGPLPPLYAAVSNFAVSPFAGWLPDGLPPLVPNPAEVDEIIEAPLVALADPAIYHEEVWQRSGIAHTIHFYDFGPYRIWGLTGRILYTFLALLPSA